MIRRNPTFEFFVLSEINCAVNKKYDSSVYTNWSAPHVYFQHIFAARARRRQKEDSMLQVRFSLNLFWKLFINRAYVRAFMYRTRK